MNPQRDIDLVDELLTVGFETSWLEFKKNNVEPDTIGVRCSALANAARLAGKDRAYMLWGIEDQAHGIVGTTFNPDSQKAHGQELAFWLAHQLQPSIAFEFRPVAHPRGPVVILEIPAATSAPVTFKNIPYIRIGSATPKLTDYPERYHQLIEKLRPYTWENALAEQYITGDDVLESLDYSSYFRLTHQPLPDNRKGIFDKLCAEGLIGRDVGEKWNITNLGAILFGTDLAAFGSSLARKAVRFIAYGGRNKAATVTHRADGNKGYALWHRQPQRFPGVWCNQKSAGDGVDQSGGSGASARWLYTLVGLIS